ncbi:D-glycerate dehydrogenase [bacterium 3DAC]|nr:D-glycerate dehydrogenase [bacterium 3DAC]
MPYIYVTRRIPEEGLKLLKERGWDIYIHEDELPPSREELLRRVQGADAILSLLTDKIDKEVFDAAGENLKIVANYAVGYDNIDIDEATKRGIIVTNTPGVLTDTTADFGWALLMAIARRVVEADQYARSGQWKTWGPMLMLGTDVHGKTLGIIGFGRIGRTVAKRAKGFDMNVLYYDPIKADEETERQLNAKQADLDTLLKESDFIVICAKLTPENRHLLNKEAFQKMKNSAYLINIARGPIVDEEALVWALKNGEIKGAGLDVFEHEPKIHPELIKMDNVVLTPHIGSASEETRGKMAQMAASSIVAVLTGKIPENIVNPEVLKK